MIRENFKIVTDSASDITGITGVNFESAPLKIITDEREYVDNAELDVSTMIKELKSYKGHSSTACPSPADFLDAFGEAQYVFCVTLTSQLSGSFSAATIAKEDYEEEHPDRRVYVIDSLSAGPEIRLIVEKLGELIADGHDFDTICEKIEEYTENTGLYFCLESLTNFANNGRVNPAIAKMAESLGIRMVGKAHEGTLKVLMKCCGKKKSMAALLDKLYAAGYKGGKLRIAYCDNEAGARELAIEVRKKYEDSNIKIYHTRGLCSFYAERGGLLVAYEK